MEYITLRYFVYQSQFKHSEKLVEAMESVERYAKENSVTEDCAFSAFVDILCNRDGEIFKNKKDEKNWLFQNAESAIEAFDHSDSSDRLIENVLKAM